MNSIKEFLGDKSITFSFRLKISEVEKLLNGGVLNIEIKGKEFKIMKREVNK